MTNLNRISSLRKVHPIPHNLSALSSLNVVKNKLDQLKEKNMLNISFGMGGISRPTTTGQSDFKPRGKKGSGTAKKTPIFDLASVIKEASEYNRMYWKEELEKIIKEFGFKSLSGELKKMVKELGITKTKRK